MYHIHHLSREADTIAASYGYTGTVGYDYEAIHGHGMNLDLGSRWDDVFGVGEIIAFPDAIPRPLPLVKSLECRSAPSGETTIVERLLYRIGDTYWPYRIRTRTPTNDDIIVGTNAISQIHRLALVQKHEFVDPRLVYARAWAESPQHTHSASAWRLYTAVEQHVPFTAFGTHSLTPSHTQNDLLSLSAAMSHSTMLGEEYGARVLGSILPTLSVFDGLTLLGAMEPLSETTLRRRWQAACTDIAVPPSLQITYPGCTHFNADTHADEVHQIDRLAASDVDVEYILLHSAVIQTITHQYYDRFVRLADRELEDQRKLQQVARMLSFRYASPVNNRADIDRTLRVRLRRTFNEEAVFEIGYTDERSPTVVYYYDLAALSLCGIGLTTQLAT